jgi:hypothetical protein
MQPLEDIQEQGALTQPGSSHFSASRLRLLIVIVVLCIVTAIMDTNRPQAVASSHIHQVALAYASKGRTRDAQESSSRQPACAAVARRRKDRRVGERCALTKSNRPRVPFRFFSPSSFWNKALPANAPLDPSSAAVISALDAEIASEKKASEVGPYINTIKWSVPIYTVPIDEPMVKVRLEVNVPLLQAAWDSVPLPSGAKPAAGTDKHLVVWQPSTDRMWEFWHLEHTLKGWRAGWGGAMRDVQSSQGTYGLRAWPGARSDWGASAASLPIAGGLITLEDLELGKIDHVLAMAVPNVRAGVYTSPAQRTTGHSTEPDSLPEGARLRLKPSLNLKTLHLPKLALMIAEAAQRYGIVLRDKSDNPTFFAQDPTPTGRNPYIGPNGYFEGKYANQILASFPWSDLELLKMDLHRICSARSKAAKTSGATTAGSLAQQRLSLLSLSTAARRW